MGSSPVESKAKYKMTLNVIALINSFSSLIQNCVIIFDDQNKLDSCKKVGPCPWALQDAGET